MKVSNYTGVCVQIRDGATYLPNLGKVEVHSEILEVSSVEALTYDFKGFPVRLLKHAVPGLEGMRKEEGDVAIVDAGVGQALLQMGPAEAFAIVGIKTVLMLPPDPHKVWSDLIDGWIVDFLLLVDV